MGAKWEIDGNFAGNRFFSLRRTEAALDVLTSRAQTAWLVARGAGMGQPCLWGERIRLKTRLCTTAEPEKNDERFVTHRSVGPPLNASCRSVDNGLLPLVADPVKNLTMLDIGSTAKASLC